MRYLVRSFKYRLYPNHEQQSALWQENLRRQQMLANNRLQSSTLVFSFDPEQSFLQDSRLHLPCVGGIKLKLQRKLPGKVKTVTIKRETSGRWYVVFSVLVSVEQLIINQSVKLEIDQESNLRSRLAGVQDKLQLAKAELQSKQLGSRNWSKQLEKVARLEERLRCMELDWWHKKTSRLARVGQVPEVGEVGQVPRWARRMWEYKFYQAEKLKGA